jgi:hypothetical protein
MRCALTGLLVTLVLSPPLAGAADEPAPAEPAPTYTTEVKGTVPELVGRWFVVSQLSLPQGDQPVAVVPSFWEVTAPEGKPTLTVRFVKPPPSIGDAIEAANKERRTWEPGLQELQALRDGWNTLAPEDRGVATVETTVTGKDAFTDAIESDEKMKDAQFLIQVIINFSPGGQRPMKDVLLYGAKESQTDGWRGSYASATLAAAPFPIPISFVGTFRMYRLESVPRRGLLERILDLFAGCGRKA